MATAEITHCVCGVSNWRWTPTVGWVCKGCDRVDCVAPAAGPESRVRLNPHWTSLDRGLGTIVSKWHRFSTVRWDDDSTSMELSSYLKEA